MFVTPALRRGGQENVADGDNAGAFVANELFWMLVRR